MVVARRFRFCRSMAATALPGGEAAAYFIIAFVLDVVAGLRVRPGVLHGDLVNPDTFMRLVRLRDILEQHIPLHVVQRDGSGDGTLLHWSHLLDSLLLILAAPLRLWLDADDALHGAALALGPVSVGLLGVAAAWAMAPLADRGWRWTAPMLAALAPAISTYGVPGVAHHHVLLGLGAVMMAGSAGRVALGYASAGWTLGVWAAFGIWLSPEAMPFIVMAFGGMGLAWLLRPGMRCIGLGIAVSGSVFLLLTGLALSVDPPAGGIASAAIDGISVVFLLLAAIICAVGWSLFGLGRSRCTPLWRGVLGGASGVGGLLLWVALFPAMLLGAGALIDTPEARVMYSGIQEMLPITSITQIMVFLLDGTGAALLLMWLALRDRSTGWRSALWAYAALCVFAMVVLGQMHARFATYGAAAAAAVLPVALTECTRLLSGRSLGLQAAARLALLAAMLLANHADALPRLVGAAGPASPPSASTCKVRGLGPMLAPYAGQTVLTDVNDVPELLYRSGIQTVGSLYRNVAAFSRLYAAWQSGPSEEEPAAVRTTRAAFVLACRQATDTAADPVKQTLSDRLARGEVPAWLRPVATDPSSGFVLYRIVNSPR
jgi:hypothetical protein